MSKKFPAGILVIGLIHLSLACSGNTGNHSELSDHSFLTLQLSSIFEFTESDELVFQQIGSVKSDRYGNIFVHDFSQPVLFMFNKEGEFLNTIGREGPGPGEFQQIASFMITREQLWIMDAGSIKIEVFEYQNADYVYANTITLGHRDLTGSFLGKTKENILITNQISLAANSRNNPTEQPITLINEQGNVVRDSIFMVPIPEQISIRGSGRTLLTGKSFGNRSLMAFDGESRVYSLWTDSLSVDTHTIEGYYQHAFSYSLEPVKITDEEKDSVSNRYGESFRTDLRRQLPDVKPIVNNFILDDFQRVWIELLTEELGHGWFCFTNDGEPLYKIDIPKVGAELQEISGNQVLWNYPDKDGAPVLVASKIDFPEI